MNGIGKRRLDFFVSVLIGLAALAIVVPPISNRRKVVVVGFDARRSGHVGALPVSGFETIDIGPEAVADRTRQEAAYSRTLERAMERFQSSWVSRETDYFLGRSRELVVMHKGDPSLRVPSALLSVGAARNVHVNLLNDSGNAAGERPHVRLRLNPPVVPASIPLQKLVGAVEARSEDELTHGITCVIDRGFEGEARGRSPKSTLDYADFQSAGSSLMLRGFHLISCEVNNTRTGESSAYLSARNREAAVVLGPKAPHIDIQLLLLQTRQQTLDVAILHPWS